MRRVLILGGGFGGVATAHALRQQLPPEDEIIVIDRRTHFMVGFRKTWALTGESTLEAGMRPLAALKQQDIRVMQETVTAIDPAGRAAEIDGQRMEADAIVVALGAQLAPDSMPGFAQYALNPYDRRFVPAAAETLRDFRGGRVVVGVFGVPYKCPPAPYEIALALQDLFREREVSVEMEVFSPQPRSLPLIGQAGCDVLEGRLQANGIGFLPSHKATAVEEGEVLFEDGERRSFDLLLGVPPHKVPDVVAESGLTGDAPWVQVDPRTLATAYESVYAIGDHTHVPMANGKRLPMAGYFAEREGQYVAGRIVAGLDGRADDVPFDGTGHCFLEVGNGEAVLVRGDFLDEDGPQVSMTEASAAFLEEKRQFESERLTGWFGE